MKLGRVLMKLGRVLMNLGRVLMKLGFMFTKNSVCLVVGTGWIGGGVT